MISFTSFWIFFGLISSCLGQVYWYETIVHQGVAPYNPQGTADQVFRNVKDFEATGNGIADDAAANNTAITYRSRYVEGIPRVGCASATNSPAVVYFSAGTYLISSPIIPYYMTQGIRGRRYWGKRKSGKENEGI
ncbi:hypothetical protein EAF00_003281 [Botryotinia globosa]|nr:hypothetical protein EAF00_003281 [Botryotinia globosa]